jgi:RimJ/RimL family protein N-acetyltransferase
MKIPFETSRLRHRYLGAKDGAFLSALMNEPAYHRFIGDRGVRSADDAVSYIANRIAPAYTKNGFGFYAVDVIETNETVGISGLVKRDGLEDVDLGFAFLARTWGKGYATESGLAVVEHARALGIKRLLGITNEDNEASVRVLLKLGLREEGRTRLPGETIDVRLFGLDL